MRHWGPEMKQQVQGHTDRQAPRVLLAYSRGGGRRRKETVSLNLSQVLLSPNPRSCFRPDARKTKHQAGSTALSLSHSLGFLASGHTGTFPGQQLVSWLLLYQVRSCLRTGPLNWIFLRGQEKKMEKNKWEGSWSRVRDLDPT